MMVMNSIYVKWNVTDTWHNSSVTCVMRAKFEIKLVHVAVLRFILVLVMLLIAHLFAFLLFFDLLTLILMTQICLSFYEVKNKHPSWFTNKIERLYWEQWYVNLNVTQHLKPHPGKSHNSKVVVDKGGTVS